MDNVQIVIILASGKMARQSINRVSYLIDTMGNTKKDASRRITIVMPENLYSQVSAKQARRIETTLKTVSFSSMVCQLIRKGLVA